MNMYIIEALNFLIRTLFGLYITALLLRVLLQLVKANFYNPLAQFVVKLTSSLVVPMRRLIPGFKGIDWATILVLFIVTFLQFSLLYALSAFSLKDSFLFGLTLRTIGAILHDTLFVFYFAIIGRALMSMMATARSNPIFELAMTLTEKLMQIARRYSPVISGIDLSPFFIIIVLILINILIINPIINTSSLLLGVKI